MKPLAGLAAAFLCAWFFCPVPTSHPFSSSGLIAAGVGFTALIALAALVGAQLARLPFHLIVRSLIASLWFAPLAILGFQGSAWSAVPLIALVTIATPLFGWNRQVPPPSSDAKLLRQFPSSLIAAAVIQLAAVETLLHHQEVAGILLSAGAVVIAWRATAIDPRVRTRPVRAAAMIAIVVALVLFGMLPFRAVPGPTAVAANSSPNATDATGDGVTADSYRGVILLPEIQHKVTLVPPLPALINNPFRENTRTLQIPFYGVYWFFRRPYTHPPQDSIEMHGKPSELTFRSHDARPLIMEAHQSLGTPFKVSCCGSIQLSITNRSRFTGTVSIELLLVDTFSDEKPSQSLGMLPVESVYGMNAEGPGVNEVLDYPIPPSPVIRQFDEFTIRFHRPFMLARESPNVSIDGFTLKPR